MTDATVIIAAWKAEAHLARSVESALAQRDVDLEVIIIDDASPDGTARKAQELAARDRRVSVLQLTENAGPAGARNAGLDAACGKWIAVLDADDAMMPGRLAAMIALAKNHGADAIYDGLQFAEAGGRPAGRPRLAAPAATGPAPWTLETFLAGNQVTPGRLSLGYLKPLISKDFMDMHNMRYNPALRNGEDFHLMLGMLAKGAQLWFQPEPGYLYTIRAGSVSNRFDPAHARALSKADAEFLARHGAALSTASVALMHRRQRRIADLAATEAAMQALRAARPDRAAAELMRRPQAFARFLSQLGAALWQRLR
ncbi:glycosyltransferase family 2 protein (plasmid) [Leisingera sp. NJS201]|uniref:glycosyltransferase family 2 protein n=1 Tax=Leisingera sp. NJS201 TaxID=2508306 RepID=UPI001070D04F|nr:glycosyltransferase family 2 protein [Leisingera sp. NJS201]QBR38578.1 glycosyltransferase family 2 protein [Leisingera sp. NJS201]